MMRNHPFSGRSVAVAAAALVALVLVALIDGVTGSHASPGTLPFSNEGVPVQGSAFAPNAKQFIAGDAATSRLLAARSGLAFYVSRRSGVACYSTGDGKAGQLGRNVSDSLGCPSDFPSAAKPILDDTFVAMNPDSGEITVLRLSGLAADTVARVEVISTDGAISSAPVINNVYDLPGLSVPASAIAAYDASGARLYTIPLSPTG